jgi:hypothetical protein
MPLVASVFVVTVPLVIVVPAPSVNVPPWMVPAAVILLAFNKLPLFKMAVPSVIVGALRPVLLVTTPVALTPPSTVKPWTVTLDPLPPITIAFGELADTPLPIAIAPEPFADAPAPMAIAYRVLTIYPS